MRLKGVHPVLVDKVDLIFEHMTRIGHPMFVVHGVRTAEHQHSLWLKGRRGVKGERRVTDKDGYTARSNHQTHGDGLGHAVDAAFLPTSVQPDPFAQTWPWREFGLFAESLGLRWGGRYPKLVDLAHIEWVTPPKIVHRTDTDPV